MSEALHRKEQDHYQDLITSEAEINELKIELQNQRNELAIEQATQGAPTEASPEALRILKNEYEPRFQTLYRECHFKQEFYKDFFIPSHHPIACR